MAKKFKLHRCLYCPSTFQNTKQLETHYDLYHSGGRALADKKK